MCREPDKADLVWRFQPDCECGPDAEHLICAEQRSVAFAARQRAREGKSMVFQASPARGKGEQHETTLPPLRRPGCT